MHHHQYICGWKQSSSSNHQSTHNIIINSWSLVFCKLKVTAFTKIEVFIYHVVVHKCATNCQVSNTHNPHGMNWNHNLIDMLNVKCNICLTFTWVFRRSSQLPLWTLNPLQTKRLFLEESKLAQPGEGEFQLNCTVRCILLNFHYSYPHFEFFYFVKLRWRLYEWNHVHSTLKHWDMSESIY
jgi:hypothetical protein